MCGHFLSMGARDELKPELKPGRLSQPFYKWKYKMPSNKIPVYKNLKLLYTIKYHI